MSDYVARRITALDAAIAALAAVAAVSAEIEAERTALREADALDASDRSAELALLAWLRALPPGVADGTAAALAAVQADAVAQLLEQPSQLSAAALDAVMQLRQQHTPTLSDVPALRAAAQSDAAFDELIWAALRARFVLPVDQRVYLYRDVAVLLPLRLETVFEQTQTGWTMLLRIIPDEASIRRDETLPTALEIEGLRAFWQITLDELPVALRASPPQDWLDSARARLAWGALCARCGYERAAWLIAAHPPTLIGDTVTLSAPTLRERSSPNRVGGFPRQIEIWIAFGVGTPQRIDTTEIDRDALVFDVIGARTGSDGSTLHEQDRWWISWEIAQRVGLGRVITLPDGLGPADIRVLYAIGLGDDNPEAHFRAQIAAGEMALLPLGAPTNSVDGEQAASLGHDELAWLRVAQRRLRHQAAATTDNLLLSQSLAGLDAALPALPTAPALANLDRLLVSALWPALWGHQRRDLWGCTDEADELAEWAHHWLRPEGPLPPIRIADQAYGLLPTSALSRWRVSAEEGALAKREQRLVDGLLTMRAHWQAAARERGTVVGATTAGVLDLLGRDAVSASYAYRFFLPAAVWQALYASSVGIDAQQFDAWLRDRFALVHGLVGRSAQDPPGMREYLAVDTERELRIPLVTPRRWPTTFFEQDAAGQPRLDAEGKPVLALTPQRALAQLLDNIVELGRDVMLLRERWRGLLPDSLLIRLAIESGLLSAAAAVQSDLTGPAPLLEPLIGNSANRTRIAELAAQYDPALAHVDPADTTRRMVLENLHRLGRLITDAPPETAVLAQLERALRATLDTATHRIDPWITGMAARRLEHLRALPQTRFRLGLYGWLDGPLLGQPGPTRGGLLHAPSHAQALTSVVLRDKFISEALEAPPGRNVWSLQLESQRVRLAEEIAEEVRLGSHVFEVLGRYVERIMSDDAAPIGAVDTLRLRFPIQAAHADRAAVCHGVDALAGLLDSAAPVLPPTAAQRERLVQLRFALDAYGDLLVAESVHQVVTGHADTAGAAMDAAAGLAAPPSLAFTRTPLDGDALSTAVLFVIPFTAASDDPQPGGSPATIADGSVPAALERVLGAAADWTWTRSAGDGVELARVTLLELGFAPIDVVVLSSETLDDVVRFRLGAEREERLGGTGRAREIMARDFVSAIGSQPALLRDLAALDEAPLAAQDTRAGDAAILADLRARYAVLREAAQRLIDALSAALAAQDEAALRVHLFGALRWGIRPQLSRAEQRSLWSALLDAAPAAELLSRVAADALAALKTRLAAAPAADSREPIARKLAELAAPDGRLAIFSRVERGALLGKSRIDTRNAEGELDATWLPVVAAVRAPVARLEALQLQIQLESEAPGFVAWSSSPGDPWRTAALSAARERRKQVANVVRDDIPRLVVAYTLGAQTWQADGGELAVGLLDSWSETAPRSEQTTTAAFGFNAPAARPPQAILLAVPATLDDAFGTQLTAADLVQIVSETRALAHARAVDAERLGPYLSVMSTVMLPASGNTGVRLDENVDF